MIKKYLIIVLFSLTALTGCLKFGNDEETNTPTTDQVARCKSEMYLNSSATVIPLGYKLLGSGIDDAIWFKFKIQCTDISEIFDTKIVDITKFKHGFNFFHDMKNLEWWDVSGKDLIGGQVSLPNARCMNVGLLKIEDGYIVYIMWHET
ncbi:MAG: hypothetical protein GXY41_01670 [Phycisphaerae bacterium]|nr:hypothetical protein [Phycisphaerae bacterium]